MGKGEDTNDFNIYGPFYLTSIDWTSSKDRTAVVASLVKGVYTLEHDRREKREDSESKAKPWWEFFDFTLIKTLTDDDSSIYGAVFEYKHYDLYKSTTDAKVPCYVIAFRGTVLKGHTWKSDLKLNLKIVFNGLNRGRRSMHAVESVSSMVDKDNESGVWLAGHSLGAGLVLLVGKTMAKSGFYLESYIFNPPIIWSIPSEKLQIIKDKFQFRKSVVKAIAFPDLEILFQEDDQKLASWIPYLYVNPADPICAGCIGYFRDYDTFRSKMAESQINRNISKVFRNLFFKRKGESSTSSELSKEPLHLLESADVTINNNKPTESIGPHDLRQWWQPYSTLSQEWEILCIRPNYDFRNFVRSVLPAFQHNI